MEFNERANCSDISDYLKQLGDYLDEYQKFRHDDAVKQMPQWQAELNKPLPTEGIGIENVMKEMGDVLIPNASQIPNPACTSYITTGATNIGALTTLASAVVSPQRIGITAFSYLEELSLNWLAEMFCLPSCMKGVYSSGGSVANIVALGAARQWAFEKIDCDPARDGVSKSGIIYATEAAHHTIQRAAAVLGLGRRAVTIVAADDMGRMIPAALIQEIEKNKSNDYLPIAIVANAGTTSTGAIDPLNEIGEIAKHYDIWFHVDGAYGLPGIMDPEKKTLYDGLALADSVIVDPHKWLGAPVGIGATFVRDRNILHRAFTQGESDYLEGSTSNELSKHSMDGLGVPYYDFGVELSAPPRGAVVWALIREIGKQGMKDRICRHNAMAALLEKKVIDHPNLEVVQGATLSICCFRFVTHHSIDLNELNKRIHRKMIHRGRSLPSTALVNGKFSIRPCFIGARTTWKHVQELIDEVLFAADEVLLETKNNNFET